MINRVLTSISYIFHPLLMPLVGIGFYYNLTPNFIQKNFISGKFIPLLILTIILPILLFLILKILGRANSIHLESTRERVVPLGVYCIILVLVLERVITVDQIPELYYFFLGILIASLSCLIMALLKVKASIHMIAVSGLFMFIIALSVHYSTNINGLLALMSIITGSVATSRLHLKAHNYKELLLGVFIGTIPQLVLINNWLL